MGLKRRAVSLAISVEIQSRFAILPMHKRVDDGKTERDTSTKAAPKPERPDVPFPVLPLIPVDQTKVMQSRANRRVSVFAANNAFVHTARSGDVRCSGLQANRICADRTLFRRAAMIGRTSGMSFDIAERPKKIACVAFVPMFGSAHSVMCAGEHSGKACVSKGSERSSLDSVTSAPP